MKAERTRTRSMEEKGTRRVEPLATRTMESARKACAGRGRRGAQVKGGRDGGWAASCPVVM